MCKHVAAALYGVGARLDREPELLFTLRHVEPKDLILQAGQLPAMASTDPQAALQGSDLSALFGIDLGDSTTVAQVPAPAAAASPGGPRRPAVPKAAKTPPAAKAGKKASPTAAPRKAAKPAARKTVTAVELLERGLPRHMIHNWVTAGVLLRTGDRGVYGTTAQTERRIAAYQARAGAV
jgi:pyruvate/2-oxoglutarate dehydrogenase complex dihydrolipoamide acyltransferase (E2) component